MENENEEPPAKMKKENETKEESIESSIGIVNVSSLVNHRARVLPSWLLPPTPTNNVIKQNKPTNITQNITSASSNASSEVKLENAAENDQNINNSATIPIIKTEMNINNMVNDDMTTMTIDAENNPNLNSPITIPMVDNIKEERNSKIEPDSIARPSPAVSVNALSIASNTVTVSNMKLENYGCVNTPTLIKIKQEKNSNNESDTNSSPSIPSTNIINAPSTASTGSNAAPVSKIKVENDACVSTPTLTKIKQENNSNYESDTNSNPSTPPSVNDTVSSSSTDVPQKPPCRYGANCYRENAQHQENFYHPPGSDASTSPVKPRCWYGSSCYRKNEEHRRKFAHDRSPNNSMSNRRRRRNVNHGTLQTFDNSDSDGNDLEDFWTDASSDAFDSDFEDQEEEEEEEDQDFEESEPED